MRGPLRDAPTLQALDEKPSLPSAKALEGMLLKGDRVKILPVFLTKTPPHRHFRRKSNTRIKPLKAHRCFFRFYVKSINVNHAQSGCSTKDAQGSGRACFVVLVIHTHQCKCASTFKTRISNKIEIDEHKMLGVLTHIWLSYHILCYSSCRFALAH